MNLLKNTGLIVLIAIAFGFIMPEIGDSLKILIFPILIVLLSITARKLDFKHLHLKKDARESLTAFALNYIVLTGLILILSLLLIKNKDYRNGFIVMAFVPPAVITVPFSYLWSHESEVPCITLSICYFLSVLIFPLGIHFFFEGAIETYPILRSLVLLIIIPLIISRFLREYDKPLKKIESQISNIGLGIVTFALVGMDFETLISFNRELLPTVFVLFMRTFILGTIVYFIFRKSTHRIVYTLFSSFKNMGLAAGFVLILFAKATTVPITFGIIFELLFLAYLKWLIGKKS